jgi:hypothetical protein
MTLSLVAALRTTVVDAINTAINAGSGPGKLAVYSGTRPANADASLSGNTKLVEFTLADPASSGGSSGALPAAGTPLSATAVAGAPTTATFFRVVDSTGAVVMDGSVGTSGADLNLSSTSITSGQTVSITSGNLAALAG